MVGFGILEHALKVLVEGVSIIGLECVYEFIYNLNLFKLQY